MLKEHLRRRKHISVFLLTFTPAVVVMDQGEYDSSRLIPFAYSFQFKEKEHLSSKI